MKQIPAIIIIALSNRPLMAIAIVDHGMPALQLSPSLRDHSSSTKVTPVGGGTTVEWCRGRQLIIKMLQKSPILFFKEHKW